MNKFKSLIKSVSLLPGSGLVSTVRRTELFMLIIFALNVDVPVEAQSQLVDPVTSELAGDADTGDAYTSPAHVEFNEGDVSQVATTLGENVEQHIEVRKEFTDWLQDENLFQPKQDDRVDIQKKLEQEAKTVKLNNLVPPIYFKSGESNIPREFIGLLREADVG